MPAKQPRQARRVRRDNGYFEVWERPDGTLVRVSTEGLQIHLRNPVARRAFTEGTRARLSDAGEAV